MGGAGAVSRTPAAGAAGRKGSLARRRMGAPQLAPSDWTRRAACDFFRAAEFRW
jgi:hypothetical protein